MSLLVTPVDSKTVVPYGPVVPPLTQAGDGRGVATGEDRVASGRSTTGSGGRARGAGAWPPQRSVAPLPPRGQSVCQHVAQVGPPGGHTRCDT